MDPAPSLRDRPFVVIQAVGFGLAGGMAQISMDAIASTLSAPSIKAYRRDAQFRTLSKVLHGLVDGSQRLERGWRGPRS